MKNRNYLKTAAAVAAAFTISAAAGFTMMSGSFGTNNTVYAAEASETSELVTSTETSELATSTETSELASSLNMVTGGALDTTDLFTDRDLEQTADLSEAVSYTITDGQTITITSEGVYLISGTASNASVVVEAGDEDKVQIVLDGVSITNDSIPCIYIKSADKVFVTTTDTDNTLAVTGTFTADGETNTDAVIFSKDDLVLNGSRAITAYPVRTTLRSQAERSISTAQLMPSRPMTPSE